MGSRASPPSLTPPLSPHPSCQALLGLTIAWKLRSDDAGEPGQLELHKMAHEGGPRYRAYLESHPNARVDLTEREPAAADDAGWFASLTHLGGARGASVSSVSAAAADSDPATNAPPPPPVDLVTAAGGWDRPAAPHPDLPDSPDAPVDASSSAASSGTASDGETETFSFEVIPPPVITPDVVNVQEVDPRKREHPKWMRDMWNEKTAAVSKDVIDAELEARVDSIPPELAHVRPGQELFVTFATKSVEDFVVTWLESAERLGLSPLFVGALDEEMRAFCERRNVPTMLLKGNSVLKNRGDAFIKAGSASFKKMGTVKTKFIQDLLEMGVAPILTDADVVWLRDPRAYFRRGTYAVADALVSTDCIDVPADKKDVHGCSHVNFNTGVLHFRPTEASKTFVQAWKTKVATSTIAWMRDQPAFNLLTHEGVGGHALAPAVSVPEDKRGEDGHRMVYYAANATLRLGVLPNWLFGSGHTYFVQWHHVTNPADGAPYSVHLTYQYGDTEKYAYGKRERMRQAGIWRSDPPEYYERGKFLVLADEGAQVAHEGPPTVGTDKSAYRVAIRRHLDEDRLRRLATRNALALAKALGRILVLPAARCYCDKIWNNLNACRAPGAETFELPYACPMDHIYDLPSWFSRDFPAEFHEPGFLEDARSRTRSETTSRGRGGARPRTRTGRGRRAARDPNGVGRGSAAARVTAARAAEIRAAGGPARAGARLFRRRGELLRVRERRGERAVRRGDAAGADRRPVLLLHGALAGDGVADEREPARGALRAAGREATLRGDGERLQSQGEGAPGRRRTHRQAARGVLVRVGVRAPEKSQGDRKRPRDVPEGRRSGVKQVPRRGGE